MHMSAVAGPSTRARKRRPLALTMCALAVTGGWSQAVDKFRGRVERLVEHLEQAVALSFEDDEARALDQLDLRPQQLEVGEGIAVAAQKQDRALDLRPVLGAQLVLETGPVERIGEEDEPAVARLDRRHAGDAAAERLPAADYLVTGTRGLDEYGNGLLGAPARQVDRHRLDASPLETDDVRLHRRR